ncbi:hypothetical protein SAMN04487939_12014 [Lysobacter sp. yr284]|uniref:hypothetical protein n=1 Tax=Lysobacter sp. yr284 TaxID=1761791 RepID=UPI0008958CED|nr:hypothetical protein [Lysobacter sp. yr284]SDZ17427.1 hypothetical protein SAMN04487939_12014 [Lysobacter sp. yr284]
MADNQKTVDRFAHAKRVRFKDRLKKAIVVYPPIESLLLEIMENAPQWKDRIVPTYSDENSHPPGTVCAYLRSARPRVGKDGKGVYFEIGTYTVQAAHDVTVLNYTAPVPDTLTATLPKRDDNDQALTATIRGVALGETVLLESSRGTGGYKLAEIVLGRLISRWCPRPAPKAGEKPLASPNWPSIELMDVVSQGLKDAIQSGGGVTRISLRVSAGSENEDEDSFEFRLRDQLGEFQNSIKFHARWDAGTDPLDEESILAVAMEALEDGSGIDQIVLDLKNATKITSLSKYKMRDVLKVRVDKSNGTLYATDVVDGLWGYLDDLRVANKAMWRLINDDGYFTNNGTVSLKIKS